MSQILWAFLSPLECYKSLHKNLSELVSAKLEAQQLSIRAAKKWGILDLSTSFHYNQLEVIGKVFVMVLNTLKDFLQTTALDAKPETVIRKHKERSSIEQTIKP